MVKNTIGGKRGKSMASKSIPLQKSFLRLSEDPLEMYGCVTKINGGGMFNILMNNGDNYLGHLRGKMKGPSKRTNFVSLYSIVLVGLRDWETTKKNCDIISIYSPQDILSLSQLPHLHIHNLLNIHHNQSLSFHNNHHSTNDHHDDLFNHIPIDSHPPSLPNITSTLTHTPPHPSHTPHEHTDEHEHTDFDLI